LEGSKSQCHSLGLFCTILSFNFWMSKVRMNTFVMILNFLNDKWEPCHIIVDFSDCKHFWEWHVLAKYGLNVWIIVYVKAERDNFNTMTNALCIDFFCFLWSIGLAKTVWGQVGGIQCESAINMLQKTINHNLDQKEWEGLARVTESVLG
jgi:hypothetical protein